MIWEDYKDNPCFWLYQNKLIDFFILKIKNQCYIINSLS